MKSSRRFAKKGGKLIDWERNAGRNFPPAKPCFPVRLNNHCRFLFTSLLVCEVICVFSMAHPLKLLSSQCSSLLGCSTRARVAVKRGVSQHTFVGKHSYLKMAFWEKQRFENQFLREAICNTSKVKSFHYCVNNVIAVTF